MLGEFFLGSGDELDPVLIAAGPSGRVPCVSAKGLTPVSIASLGVLLGAGSQEEVLVACGSRHHESESGESGVWDVPPAVVGAVRGTQNLGPVAEQWVETEELKRDGWREPEALAVLDQLAELVAGQGPAQILWYWWSL
jgi:hypothetical protein